MSDVNYLTPQGYSRLRAELNHLIENERPKVVEAVAAAAAMGDRSENAEYIYGKKRLREIDRRIRFLSQRLENVQVIDPATVLLDQVRFAVGVQVENEQGECLSFQIVGEDEIDPAKGRITYNSPMGRALLGKKVGDQVIVQKPSGSQEYFILKIFRVLD